MHFFEKTVERDIDAETDGSTLASYSPAFARAMESIKQERLYYEHAHGRAKGITTDGDMQKIGRVPRQVFDYLTLIHGPEWMNSKEFMKWLDRHPEYKVGRTLVSAVTAK